jgi:MFS family permease
MPEPTALTVRQQGLVRWRNAVMAAFALGGLTLATWGPRLPTIRADLGLDTGALGVLLAGVTVGSIVGLTSSAALLAGLGARQSIRRTLSIVAVGIALVGAGSGSLHSLPVTGVGFVLVGFGIGAVDVMINVEGAAVEREANRTLMPLMHAAWSVGAIIGSAIGAACAATGIAPQWQFFGEAFIILVAASVAVQSIPAGTRRDQPSAATGKPVSERIRGFLRGWADRRLLVIGVVMLGVELGEGSANNWLTLAVRDGHGQSEAVAAAFFTAFAIGETLARLGGGPLVDRFGRVHTVRSTTALGVAGLLLFIRAGPAWLVLVGVLLWAVGVSMGFPLGMSAAADSGPNSAARVSVVASIGYLANLSGPPIIGFLAQAAGLLNALWLVAALLVVSFMGAGALRTRAAEPSVEA